MRSGRCRGVRRSYSVDSPSKLVPRLFMDCCQVGMVEWRPPRLSCHREWPSSRSSNPPESRSNRFASCSRDCFRLATYIVASIFQLSLPRGLTRSGLKDIVFRKPQRPSLVRPYISFHYFTGRSGLSSMPQQLPYISLWCAAGPRLVILYIRCAVYLGLAGVRLQTNIATSYGNLDSLEQSRARDQIFLRSLTGLPTRCKA